MRVGDAIDSLLAECPYGPVRFAAIAVLGAAYERCAPEFYGGGAPCARQMSGEAVANVRASLVAALAAFDAARLAFPSGPMGVVPDERSLNANVVAATRSFE